MAGKNPGRKCFVTVGATAGFRQLLDEISNPSFLSCIASLEFDSLEVQCGPDFDWLDGKIKRLDVNDTCGIKISCFQYTNSIKDHMIQCRGEAGIRPAGCVISHAGSGTILEAKRYAVPLVVVPNPTLMNNHQAELARECEKQDWAIYGRLGKLDTAVRRSQERVHQGRLDELPPYTPPAFPVPESKRIKMFDWMVLTCYPEELERQQHKAELNEVDRAFWGEFREQQRQEATMAPEITSRLQLE